MTAFLHFDHVGIVVADADAGTRSLAALLGATAATERVDDEGLTVSVRFLKDRSGIVYELIAPFGSPSVVDSVLRRGANIINQVAYRTCDLGRSAEALARGGCMPLGSPKAAIAFGGAQVQFFLSRLGFIIELIETTTHNHEFLPLFHLDKDGVYRDERRNP